MSCDMDVDINDEMMLDENQTKDLLSAVDMYNAATCNHAIVVENSDLLGITPDVTTTVISSMAGSSHADLNESILHFKQALEEIEAKQNADPYFGVDIAPPACATKEFINRFTMDIGLAANNAQTLPPPLYTKEQCIRAMIPEQRRLVERIAYLGNLFNIQLPEGWIMHLTSPCTRHNCYFQHRGVGADLDQLPYMCIAQAPGLYNGSIHDAISKSHFLDYVDLLASDIKREPKRDNADREVRDNDRSDDRTSHDCCILCMILIYMTSGKTQGVRPVELDFFPIMSVDFANIVGVPNMYAKDELSKLLITKSIDDGYYDVIYRNNEKIIRFQ